MGTYVTYPYHESHEYRVQSWLHQVDVFRREIHQVDVFQWKPHYRTTYQYPDGFPRYPN
jgi:hypothetical protein